MRRISARQGDHVNPSQIRILLAEDNPTDFLLLKEALGHTSNVSFNISHVECLAECIEALQKERFDAVLIDLGLPDSTGLSTFQSLREYADHTVVVVLTALEDEDVGMKAVQMGAEDYLMKSEVRTSLLGRMIRYAIERTELRRKLEESRDREAHEREVRSIERLATPATQVTAAMYAGSSLREGMPEEFVKIATRYSRVLDGSLERRVYKTEDKLSDHLLDLGNDLGLLRASARDVVEVHSTVLKDKIKGLPLAKAHALLEESRLALLELMGDVVSFYRSSYIAPPIGGGE